MDITKEQLLKEYNRLIDEIADECDWVTHFTGKEVCYNICRSLKNLNYECKFSHKELYEIYDSHINSLNLSDEEWYKQYGITEIVYLIHDLITQGLENSDLS